MIEVEYRVDRVERVVVDLINYPAGEVGYRLPYEDPVTAVIVTPEINLVDGRIESSLLKDIMVAKMLSDQFRNVKVVFTYLPCGREDRRVSPNASFGLLSIDSMFSNITTVDKHPNGKWWADIASISPKNAILRAIDSFTPSTLAFPDQGAQDRYTTVIEEVTDLDTSTVRGFKTRNTATGEIIKYDLSRKVDSTDSSILVIDDICDGGRTFIELAKLLKAGNKDARLGLYVTHGIFSKGLDELRQYYDIIYTTNTILNSYSDKELDKFNWRLL